MPACPPNAKTRVQIRLDGVNTSVYGLRMDSPRRFAYGPQWRQLVAMFAVGVTLLAFVGRISFGWGAVLGFLPLTFALIGTLRRLAFPGFVELGPDTLSISTGFFQARVRGIGYADVEQTSEQVISSRMSVLRLRTRERTFEINSILLPSRTDFYAVRDFVNARVQPKERPAPLAEAGKYCIHCAYEGKGEIYNSIGQVVWRFKTLHRRPHYPYGIFRLPDFVVLDPAEKEVFRIKLERRWSLGQFALNENGRRIGTLRQRSFLRNKFTLHFASGQQWVFRLPLFSVRFGGVSGTGENIRMRVQGHKVWWVIMDPAMDTPPLVAAVAFIHREHLRLN